MKILLVYSSLYKATGLPLGVASLSAILKQNGHEVSIFETTFYNTDKSSVEIRDRENRLMAKKPSNEDEHLGTDHSGDIFDDLKLRLSEFKADIVGISIFEPTYLLCKKLFAVTKVHMPEIITIAGGVFPTLAPDVAIEDENVDIVCIGEGENSLLELCDAIDGNLDFSHIQGMWVKSNGFTFKNNITSIPDINKLPIPDYTGFDSRLFYKPMQGKYYKMVNIETTRGCPYNCSYCASPALKSMYRKIQGCSYFRALDIDKIMSQIYCQIDLHNPEFIYFSSETFLAMPKSDFEIFVKEYKKVNLPFWFQTRFETITEDKIKKLQEVGLYWMTLGVEHGNEEFRKKILNRHYKNEIVEAGMHVLNKCGVGTTLNNMAGFPFETRELVFDTISLNKKLLSINSLIETNLYIFTPFRGCALYDLCVTEGFFDKTDFINSTESNESVLKFSDEFKQDLKGLLKTFNLYVRLNEKYYPCIRIAEQDDKEGKQAYNELLQIVMQQSR
ncbi:B12-binding domain-containing radical SAM protein [Candidatus Pacearchaeota archaeon]|nr:B12-binding domain-containing radical SAM protein [Candidatus Pacearchaeota archaeon]